jgi:hypothetical protein
MNLAVHGIDVLFLILAAAIFLIGAIVALAVIEPRPSKWVTASVPGGLFFFVLAFLLTG